MLGTTCAKCFVTGSKRAFLDTVSRGQHRDPKWQVWAKVHTCLTKAKGPSPSGTHAAPKQSPPGAGTK